MIWLYVLSAVALLLAPLAGPFAPVGGMAPLIQQLAKESGIPNLVSGVILHTRLFDTIGEVLVFLASMVCGKCSGLNRCGNASAPSPTFRLGWSVAGGHPGGTGVGNGSAWSPQSGRICRWGGRWHHRPGVDQRRTPATGSAPPARSASRWEEAAVISFVVWPSSWRDSHRDGPLGSLLSGLDSLLNLLVALGDLGSWADSALHPAQRAAVADGPDHRPLPIKDVGITPDTPAQLLLRPLALFLRQRRGRVRQKPCGLGAILHRFGIHRLLGLPLNPAARGWGGANGGLIR